MAKEDLGTVDSVRRELESVKQERDKLTADLRESQAHATQLEAELHKVQSKLSAQSPKSMPAKAVEAKAYQLREAATFTASDSDKHIVTALPGDILIKADPGKGADEAAALQSELGPGHRVHPVTQATLNSLFKHGMLRE